MSSNIEILRICKHCSIEFTAKTTVTKYCTHKCSQRAYKQRKREEKIQASNTETSYVMSQPIEELKVKPFLSITDTCKLLGVSRRTVYRMIERKELVIAKAGTRTIIRRADIDELFSKPIPVRVRKEPQPVTEFYTVKEIQEKYAIKYGRLSTIIKQNRIPKTIHNGKLNVSKRHLDKYFDKVRNDVSYIQLYFGMYVEDSVQKITPIHIVNSYNSSNWVFFDEISYLLGSRKEVREHRGKTFNFYDTDTKKEVDKGVEEYSDITINKDVKEFIKYVIEQPVTRMEMRYANYKNKKAFDLQVNGGTKLLKKHFTTFITAYNQVNKFYSLNTTF